MQDKPKSLNPGSHAVRTQRNFMVYVMVAVIGVALILIANLTVGKDTVAYYLCKEVGFALVVSVVLIFTIERFTRERHQAAADELMETINKNLFYAIYKRYIPEKVFEEIEKSVMESDVIRCKHELDYTIMTLESEPSGDYVNCLAQTSYELHSVVDAKINHNVVVRLEVPVDRQWTTGCYIEEIKVDGKIYSREELEKPKFTKRSDEHVILTLPIEIGPKSVVRINTKSRIVKKTTDVELWCSRIPSDGLKLTVSTPTRVFNVHASANHSQALEVVMDNEVTKKWDLPHGIFPYQSIMFWWKPKMTGTNTQQLSSVTAKDANPV